MFKEPLDFEYNKYTLLDYIQKCEKRFDNLEIYPDFVELSLHLANIQSLGKENTLLLTKKKFESPDDEILLKELYPKKPRELTEDESQELDKTLRFSGGRLFDAFNIGKSIWNLAFDNIVVSLKRNKENLNAGMGYVYYFKKNPENLFVWEFEIKQVEGDATNNKTILNLIYEGPTKDVTLSEILTNYSNWNNHENFLEYPIFEMKSNQDFPMNETMIPMMKRKIMAYIFQVINMEIIKNFDSPKEI
jgi:hypothetical protein